MVFVSKNVNYKYVYETNDLGRDANRFFHGALSKQVFPRAPK